ncbi:MAG: threonine synthase [Candidatus Parcubacteria bacterium]|nr:threonine synthase [Candidatus Parcubacteria bacterium]
MKGIYFWHQCIECGSTFQPQNFFYVCPKCKGLLLVKRDEEWIDKHIGSGRKAQFFFDNIRFGKERNKYPNGSGVFMWLPLILPGFPKEAVISLKEGFTDLFEIPDWLKKKTGLKNLFIKMEGQLPSESFKDRGMSVAISEAIRLQSLYPKLKIKYVACASTGDTSASAAIYTAYVRDRLKCIVFLPYGKISSGQLFQTMAHGALVINIKHPKGFDGCMELIQKYCSKHPEIVLVNSKNDFRIVGQETIALEICQDLRWKAPKWISIPCGNTGNLTALMVSLLRMKERKMIDSLPSIIVAQTKGANTLVRWAKSKFKTYQPGIFHDSVASAMNIQDPVSFPRIKKLYKKFRIEFFDVAEKEIQRTRALFMGGGANICPQTAVALDAVLQAKSKRIIKENDLVVVIGTASGIKFAESGIKHHLKGDTADFANPPRVTDGTIEDIERAIGNQESF